jgi:hypothetical protein
MKRVSLVLTDDEYNFIKSKVDQVEMPAFSMSYFIRASLFTSWQDSGYPEPEFKTHAERNQTGRKKKQKIV